MGICLVMLRLDDKTIEEICTTPKKALHFFMQDEAPEPTPVGILGRLFGQKETILQKCSAPREPNDETDLDKAWDAMDYLLSDGRNETGIARFLTEGGTEVKEEIGYGFPRVLKSSEVTKIDTFLKTLSEGILRSRYRPNDMDKMKVYPQIWSRDGDDGFEYIISFLEPLRLFISEAVSKNSGIMIIYT